jgi:hypothetical protein
VIKDGVESQQLPDQDPQLSAAALVGAIGEALVGPVSPTAERADARSVISSLRDFCIRSVTGKELASVEA